MNIPLASIAHWNKPTRFGQRLITAPLLRALPEPGATVEESALDAWLVDLEDVEHGIAFGFVSIHGQSAEWGHFSLPELLALRVTPLGFPVERDADWKPTPARDIPAIATYL